MHQASRRADNTTAGTDICVRSSRERTPGLAGKKAQPGCRPWCKRQFDQKPALKHSRSYYCEVCWQEWAATFQGTPRRCSLGKYCSVHSPTKARKDDQGQCPACVLLCEQGKLEASQVRPARKEKVFRGFCKQHAPAAARLQAGLSPKAQRARASSTNAKALVSHGVRRRLRGKQAMPAGLQLRQVCKRGARGQVLNGNGEMMCKRCFNLAVTGRTGHLAARAEFDQHRDEAVPRHGLNSHRGCKPIVHARYMHNYQHCTAKRFSEEKSSSSSRLTPVSFAACMVRWRPYRQSP